MAAMDPQFAYIKHIKRQPYSNVLRIHVLHVMKESHASMQDGTVMVGTDKYRLVEIPPNCREPPNVRLTRIR